MKILQDIASQQPLLWWALLAMIGLCVGSFLNVLIYRLPIIIAQEQQAHSVASTTFLQTGANDTRHNFDLFFPASHCPECGEPIKWQNKLPLISWLCLRGKSHCCKNPISIGYLVVELAAMGVTLLCGYISPPNMSLLGVLIFSWLLLPLAVIDSKTWLLPDALTYPLLWLGLLFNLEETFISLQDAVVGGMVGYCLLWGFNYVISRLMNKNCMGYGDFKLTAAIAAWNGWQCLPQLLLLAALCGIVSILLAKLFYKKSIDRAIPFGPGLAAAGWIQISKGMEII